MEPNGVSNFLFVLGRTSAEAGVLVVLVLAVQWLFRRHLTPQWRCALWLLVAVRLALPFSFSSETSVFNLLPHQPAMVLHLGSPSEPARAKQLFPLESTPMAQPKPRPTTIDRSVSGMPFNITPLMTSPLPPKSGFAWSWPVLLLAAWLIGVLVLTGHVMISSIRLWRRCAPLPAKSRVAAEELLRECCGQFRLSNPPVLLESGQVGSPALHGVFRARLLLPLGFTEKFSPAELRFVFLHELAHLKRRDLLMNWAVVLLQVMHWFNPLVWFGFARWRAERELACDALALEAAGEGQNKEYGRTILRLLDYFSRPRTPGLVGILEDKRQLRRRIGMIASYVPNRGWPLLALVLIGVLAVVGLTDAKTKSALEAFAGDMKPDEVNANPISGAPVSAATRAAGRVQFVNMNIASNGDLTINERPCTLASLENRLQELTAANPNTRLLAKVDEAAPENVAREVFNIAKAARITDLVVVTAFVSNSPTSFSGKRVMSYVNVGKTSTNEDMAPLSNINPVFTNDIAGLPAAPFTAIDAITSPSSVPASGSSTGRSQNLSDNSTTQPQGNDMKTSSLTNQLVSAAAAGLLALAAPVTPAAAQPAAAPVVQAAAAPTAPAAPADSELANQLIGAWVLIGTPNHIGKAPHSGGRIKFFTGSHWCITQAESKSGIVLFNHGGTYTLTGDTYHESVEYANGSTIENVGHKNDFKIKIEGNRLTDIGIRNPWKEVWERLEPPASKPELPAGLTGSWVYAGKPGQANAELEPNTMKICAGGYWCDTDTDPKTGVVVVHHGGTCYLKGGKYFETCQYGNPTSMPLIGEEAKFDMTLDGDTLTVIGIGNPWKEVWKRQE